MIQPIIRQIQVKTKKSTEYLNSNTKSKTILFLDNDLDQKYPAGWRPAPTWAELRPWLPSESPPPLLNTPTSRTPCPPEPVFSLMGYLVTVAVFIG